MGTQLNEQVTPARLQDEHCFTLGFDIASHRV